MTGSQLHTLSYLKRVTGNRSQAHKCDHVLALTSADAKAYGLARSANGAPKGSAYATFGRDMRSWRPRDGWAISRTDQAWLDIPTGYVVVYRSKTKERKRQW